MIDIMIYDIWYSSVSKKSNFQAVFVLLGAGAELPPVFRLDKFPSGFGWAQSPSTA